MVKQISALNEYFQRVVSCKDSEGAVKIGFALILEKLAVDAVAIFSLAEEPGWLTLLFAEGLFSKESVRQQPIQVGEGLNGTVVKTGKPLFAYAGQPEFKLERALQAEKIYAAVIMPLISCNMIIGTLAVVSRSQRIFTKQELFVLETLAAQLSLAVENVSLSDEQKMMREKLRMAENQYREIFEKTSDIIWLEDLEGNIISGNRAFLNMVGGELSQLSEKNIFSWIPQNNLSKAKTVRKQLWAGLPKEWSYDQTMINSLGQEIILKVTTNLLQIGGTQGFQHIAKDITEERKMQENLEYYIRHITRAQEEERLRISRELHDSTAQSLIVIMHQLEKFLLSSKHLIVSDSRFLYGMVEQVKEILQEVRQFSRDLRPSILDDLGLIPSVEWYIEELNRTHGINISLSALGDKIFLRPEVRVTLFRIVQEALRNVIRHAEVSEAQVQIEYSTESIKISVSDKGKGFDCKPIGDLLRAGKLGLAGMNERAKLLCGQIQIESALGQGTTIKILIPMADLLELKEQETS
ncbi:MAG: PAS domain S-box protein [Dethiobacter sp.]|jgi:PAS domain S-box-containing protein|nr:PAS domain S-box protein [Dethiobacter sp.]MBS3983109.1 PAS domain S-box protein [Dethiobacter sp.]MCL4463985.1 PAS domain S-box protein [Bacillota bacterium]MCL5993589.1 PAS domain S-box protein [Bacillota bacterium]